MSSKAIQLSGIGLPSSYRAGAIWVKSWISVLLQLIELWKRVVWLSLSVSKEVGTEIQSLVTNPSLVSPWRTIMEIWGDSCFLFCIFG